MQDFLGQLTDEDKKGGTFSVFEPGTYELTVLSAVWGDGLDYDKNPTKQLTVKFSLFNPLDESGAVPTKDGKELINPSFTQWLGLDSFGWNKKTKQPKAGRMLATALLGVAEDGALDAIRESGDALIGKKCLATLGVKAKENGGEKNIVNSAKPVKKKS
jgi:hypothetical protein